jgi:hypothetical protein
MEVVDDCSKMGEDLHIAKMVSDQHSTEECKNDWFHMVANETEEFKDLAMKELIGQKKDFGDA